MRLDAPLPHIVLDSVSDNSLFGTNLPIGYERDQRLSLEGDFDRHFALYCPQGYEADALYLFTPDVMARFIDHASALNVEIVDDWVFLYAAEDLSALDPKTWEWLFSSVDALLGRLDQWERWRDERLTAHLPDPHPAPQSSLAPGVAEPGKRLKKNPWPMRIAVGALLVYMALHLFTTMLGR